MVNLKMPGPEEIALKVGELKAKLSGLQVSDLKALGSKVPALKKPALTPKMRKALTTCGIAVAVLVVAFVGWNLFHAAEQHHEVRVLGDAIASSEADLAGLDREVSALIGSVGRAPSLKESDTYMATFKDLADRGVATTARHLQAIEGIAVPEAHEGVREAYLQALDHLNRAYTLWSASATAYDLRHYGEAEKQIGEADREWQAYELAINDYNREIILSQEKREGS
ncbi:hypothetical protein [Methanofollis ethanolicus]|uniref:hypothetical protein n=1 Tax=Methanofollis ethanolicus TaxID=488124 RepID=UPI00082E882E|nr:hypothetical protein [Methanofollis ethanolicus]